LKYYTISGINIYIDDGVSVKRELCWISHCSKPNRYDPSKEILVNGLRSGYDRGGVGREDQGAFEGGY